ncbi:MAG: FtsX-like permease family protein [Chryseolinea sp.]
MIKNYAALAFRRMRKDWIFTVINIGGLTASLTVAMLIVRYGVYELSFDRQYANAQNIYRITSTTYENDLVRYPTALTGSNVGPLAKENSPQIKTVARLFPTRNWFECTLAYQDQRSVHVFNERQLYYADPEVITLFHLNFQQGDPATALSKPYSLILSKSIAKKYLGDEDPIGKTMHLKGSMENHDYIVSGVFNDLALNTHLDANILASSSSLNATPTSRLTDAYTYVQLNSQASRNDLTIELTRISQQLFPKKDNQEIKLGSQPIQEIHLYSNFLDDMKEGGNPRTLLFLVLAAMVVVTIACINYVNLTSAKSLTRVKELGIRKINGASNSNITFQFLTETTITLGVAIIISLIVMNFFGDTFYVHAGLIIPDNFSFLQFIDVNFGITLIGVATLVFSLTALPARVTSLFNPIQVLKGRVGFSTKGTTLLRSSVVFQFASALALLIVVTAFNAQFKFMLSQDLNVDIYNTLIVKKPTEVDSTYVSKLAAFKNDLNQSSIVHQIASSLAIPGSGIGWTGEIKKEHDVQSKDFNIALIDTDFIDSYHLKMVAGRNFESVDFPGQHFGNKVEPVILNKSAVISLGYATPENALDKIVYWGENRCRVVGVVDDFHYESLKESIKPILFTANLGPTLSLKLVPHAASHLGTSIEQIKNTWLKYFPNNPFDYSLLEDNYNAQYLRDEQTAYLFNCFCIIAIIIASLGLFALSLFTVNQRTKEIGIRKVLGASLTDLFNLLTKEYLLLVFIAAIVAIPTAMWITEEWLSTFAFRTSLTVRHFALPAILVLILSLLTVGIQTLRTVVKNPTETLKHE